MRNKVLVIALIISACFLTSVCAETGARHYFNQCKDENLVKVTKGLSKEGVRNLCGGKEYPAFETMKNGFAVALDEKRSEFFVFKDWMPTGSANRDFFITDTKLLYVRYADDDKVDVLQIYPLIGNRISQQGAGVKIEEKDARTLTLTIDTSSKGAK